MIADALQITPDNLSKNRDALNAYQSVQAQQDPTWLQTVGYVGQALNLLGVSGVTINRDSPNGTPSSAAATTEPEDGAPPVILIVLGGVVLLVVVVLLLKKD